MIITDDGEFAHNILSPRKHVKKIYEVTIDNPVTEDMINDFKRGIVLNEGKCKSADLVITGDYTAKVTISEGKYHQIKRMFAAVGREVLYLKRLSMGPLSLDESLPAGAYRRLTEQEESAIISL
jgi:16S rRNA pseudouridine516 synthase